MLKVSFSSLYEHEFDESTRIFRQKPRLTLFEFCSSSGTFVLSFMSLSLRKDRLRRTCFRSAYREQVLVCPRLIAAFSRPSHIPYHITVVITNLKKKNPAFDRKTITLMEDGRWKMEEGRGKGS